jgi:hypothetical protein
MVLCIGLRLDVIRKHMTAMEVATTMTTRDIGFLAHTIEVETIF